MWVFECGSFTCTLRVRTNNDEASRCVKIWLCASTRLQAYYMCCAHTCPCWCLWFIGVFQLICVCNWIATLYDYHLSPSKHMFMAVLRNSHHTQSIIHILTAIFHIHFQSHLPLFVQRYEHEHELRLMLFFSIVSLCFRSAFSPLWRLHNENRSNCVTDSSTCTN